MCYKENITSRMYSCLSIIAGTALLFIEGCAVRDKENIANIKWVDLINRLSEPELIARLDIPGSTLVSSSDPTRGNQDHNHFLRTEKKDGTSWIVIADIEGTGYISRFWCTGMNTGKQRIRFYFNNERKPRIDTTLDKFIGKEPPFLPPLAISNREQNCWYSYLPIPFSERVVVMIEAIDQYNGKTIMDYHHINYSLITDGRTVQTFPRQITQEHIDAINKVRTFWDALPIEPSTVQAEKTEIKDTIKPSASISTSVINGPATITRLEIEPDFNSLPSAIDREKLLRDMVLQIKWNGKDEPSVNVPTGDFFGSFIRRTRFKTLYIGMDNSTFFTAFPMPFEKSAEITIKNDGKFEIPVALRCFYRKMDIWDNNLGYFHSAWNKSGPEQKGLPHVMLETGGRGKYVGCFLSITSMDRSWWPLESNEYIYTDDETSPGWKGTGLEDYFNGGWYYQNPKVRPLAGLLFHVPFKTVQYRFHMSDPVNFNNRIYFEFERGPKQVSNADMESSVYYYLSSPSPVRPVTLQAENRYETRHELEELTLMIELNNQDNIGDMQGAYDHINEYLERFPNYEHKEMLRLRQIAYREAMNGFESVRKEYSDIINSTNNKYVAAEAKKILWFHENESHALLRIYSNAETFPFIDGKTYGRFDHPEMAFSMPVVLTPGKHVICLKTRKTRQMPWALVHLRTHKGTVLPSDDWKYSLTYESGIHTLEFDDSSWTSKFAGMKGPPEIPYVRMVPNPYVNMYPNATLVRPEDSAGPDGYIYYRREFDF